MKKKFVIITTVPMSLFFFKGQVRILQSHFDVEVVSSGGEQLDRFCKSENVRGYAISMARSISILKDFRSLIQLINLFKQIKPDLIHGNTPKGANLSLLAGKLVGVKKRVYCIHGLRYQGASGLKKILLKNIERLSCALATDIITVSFGVKEQLKVDHITKKAIKVIWNGSVNGIDSNIFDPELALAKPIPYFKFTSNDLVLGFVGRLVRDKGVNELINAFGKLSSKYTHIKLLLVGDFEHSNAVTNETRETIKNHSSIFFAGWQPDIRPYLKMMNLFVFPSYREGFGLSLMEAATYNVPAISSDIIGCNEIIENNYNGVLIPSKDEEALLNALDDLISNPTKIDKMASVARAFVLAKYEQEKLWKYALETYKNI